VSAQETPPTDILDAIGHCAAAMDDEPSLKDELHVLRLSSYPLAHCHVHIDPTPGVARWPGADP
jgi:hypothetical protein